MQGRTTTLFLRSMPVDVVREAKAQAARQGVTLAAYVANALAVVGPGASVAERDADWAWFEKNRERLARRYPNEYVAIIDERVVDHDGDFEALALRVADAFGRSAFIPKATPKERVFSLRSPRLRRG